MLKEHNLDTVLYCAPCCGERLCGYLGVRVYHTEEQIIWHIGLYNEVTEFRFDRKSYFAQFQEYIDLVNLELKQLGVEEVNILEAGESYKPLKTSVEALKSRFRKLNQENIGMGDVFTVLKEGNVHEMDGIIQLAEEYGISNQQIMEKLEKDYSSLNEGKKNNISWRMLDYGEFFSNLDLENWALVKKAYLLYR